MDSIPVVLDWLFDNAAAAMLICLLAAFVFKLAVGFGIYSLYVLALSFAAYAAAIAQNMLYFWAFLLGALTAFTEIIGKFSDEPLKSFKTKEAFVYHLINGGSAAFSLYILTLFDVPMGTPLDKMKAVLTAGFGSMLILRSKLFNLKVGEHDVSFGPEQFVKVFFRFMEQAIDRVRAQARIDFVTTVMKDVDCEKYEHYIRVMLEAAQLLDDKERKALVDDLGKICQDENADKQNRSYHLGFLLLNKMGEDFVSKVFSSPPPDWRIKAPIPQETGGLIARAFGQKEEYVQYFAYGRDMSIQKLMQRLNWSDEEIQKAFGDAKPVKASLPGFRIAFGKPSDKDPQREGLATIVPDRDGAVEGVLYRLPAKALTFLDTYNPGYKRVSISFEDHGRTVEWQTYRAEAKTGLKPTRKYLDALLLSAEEHALSPEYIQTLKSAETLALQ